METLTPKKPISANVNRRYRIIIIGEKIWCLKRSVQWRLFVGEPLMKTDQLIKRDEPSIHRRTLSIAIGLEMVHLL